MSAIGKWGMVAVATGMVLTVSSCAPLHRHHRELPRSKTEIV